MRRQIILVSLTLPLSSFAQFAEDEFCSNLTVVESMSSSEIDEYAKLSDEYVVDLMDAIGGDGANALDEFPDNWAKHGLRVQVASCYISGKGTKRDIGKAMVLLEEPAEAGYPIAVHILASLRLFSSDDPSLQRLGFEALEQEHKAGSAFAAGKLGWAYQKGLGVEPNQEKALELYQYAAKNGMTYWQYLLAHAYEKGYLGLIANPDKAVYWAEYKPKVHIALYECWVATYYADGTFPENDKLRGQYQKVCDETNLGDWWANFNSE